MKEPEKLLLLKKLVFVVPLKVAVGWLPAASSAISLAERARL
ncbi:MAG: hypothetical protein AB7V46_22620 [Thermomicrobiales bacterium]